MTVLTATYDRAHLLPRLHASLQREGGGDLAIDWLVVDDGSQDDTPRVVTEMAADNALPVTLLRLPHGGKHRALNAGFAQARGDWILVVDSDDWLMPGGLARARAEIGRAQNLGATVISLPLIVPKARRQYRFLRPRRLLSYAARLNEEPPFDSTLIFRKGSPGLVFPEFTGEAFLAEAALLCRVAEGDRLYIANALAVYAEYQPDGLSMQMRLNRMRSPVGASFVYQTMLEKRLRPTLRRRALANFGRFWWHALLRGKRPRRPRGLSQLLILPLAWPFALRDILLVVLGR